MSSFPSADPLNDWYNTPLSLEDWLAGGSLLILCLIFIPLTGIVTFRMYKADKEIIGYRYLVSSAFIDILCMVQYGGLNGIAILTKNPLAISKDGRSAMQFYIDWVWFAFCLNYPLVAWSRFAAIKIPMWFCRQKRWQSYLICFIPYLIALVLCCSTHWSPFFVRFYFEPSAYGMLAEDFAKYLIGGHSTMFMCLHIFCVAVPLMLYLWTIVIILGDKEVNGVNGIADGQLSVEKRLMVPCIIGNFIFVLGQVAITIGTGTGKWATWLICLLFFINSAVNSVLLLLFSPFLRASILPTLKTVTAYDRTTISVVELRR